MATGLSDAAKTAILDLMLNGVAYGGSFLSNAATSWWHSLHTTTPVAGDQTTGATGYTGYVRLEQAITTGEWTVTDDTAVNVNALSWENDPMTGGTSGTISFTGMGLAESGTGTLVLVGTIGVPKSLDVDEFFYLAPGAVTVRLLDLA